MNINSRRFLYLTVGFVLLLLTGLIYAWSIFIVPLENEFGWVRKDTSTIFTITMASFCIGGMVNGFIIGRTSPRFTLCIAAILFFVGFFFASRTETLWQIFLSYGVFIGFGVGLVYNTIISTITKWFPDRKGFASGVSLMGFGLGGFILGTVASMILEVSDWRLVFIVFAIAFPILVLASSFIIRIPQTIEIDNLPKPKAAKTASAGSDETKVLTGSDEAKTKEITAKPAKDINTVGMLKTPVFWLFFLWTLLLSAAGLMVIGHASPISEAFISSPRLIGFAVGLVTICNGVARVIYGMMFDRFGIVKSIYAVALNAVIASITMVCAIGTGSLALMIIGFILTGGFYGGAPTTNSTFVMAQFGQKNFAANFSVVNLNLLIAPILGTYIAAALYDSTGTYLKASGVMVGYAAVATLLSFIINRLVRKSRKKDS